jgi:hypothetical protein
MQVNKMPKAFARAADCDLTILSPVISPILQTGNITNNQRMANSQENNRGISSQLFLTFWVYSFRLTNLVQEERDPQINLGAKYKRNQYF